MSSNSFPHAALPTHHWIRRLRITGGGYLDGVDIEFAPGGNVICGGPGVGKSTLLELLRYALALAVPPEKRAELADLVAANLGPGRVHVTLVTAHGVEYEVSRGGGDVAPRVDSPASAAGNTSVADLFPIRFAGHGELESMARNGLARLDLLARFAWDDYRRIRDDLAHVRAELDAQAAPLVRLNAEIGVLAQKHATLAQERARLEALKEAAGGDPVDLGAAQERKALASRERAMLERADAELGWLRGEMGTLVATVQRRLGQAVDADAMRGPNAALLAEAGKCLKEATSGVEEMATRIASDAARAQAALTADARALAAIHAEEETAYRALLGTHEHNAARAFERLELEKRVADLERAKRDHDARIVERRQTQAARDELRARMRLLVEERTALLDRTAARVEAETHGHVRVIVHREAERTAYRALLGELVKGKRFETDALDAIAGSIGPDDLCAQVLRGDASVIEDKLGSKPVAMRFVATLLESPRVYALETVDVPDVPAIALLHGTKYKASETLSAGQRTVAFASILLLDRRGPLLIDQPEDNLANVYLAQYLCGVLADAQKETQLVFVTHNGNIPILGHAERVFEFQGNGERGWVAAQGALEAVLEPMENNFEGGHQAFVKRKEFYGV